MPAGPHGESCSGIRVEREAPAGDAASGVPAEELPGRPGTVPSGPPLEPRPAFPLTTAAAAPAAAPPAAAFTWLGARRAPDGTALFRLSRLLHIIVHDGFHVICGSRFSLFVPPTPTTVSSFPRRAIKSIGQNRHRLFVYHSQEEMAHPFPVSYFLFTDIEYRTLFQSRLLNMFP